MTGTRMVGLIGTDFRVVGCNQTVSQSIRSIRSIDPSFDQSDQSIHHSINQSIKERKKERIHRAIGLILTNDEWLSAPFESETAVQGRRDPCIS